MSKDDNFPLRLINKSSVRRLSSNYVLFIPVFTTLSADLKGSGYDAARVEYVNWLIFYFMRVSYCLIRICGLWH